jgi:RimJ/RimL family protein N-acetyltransferase
VNPETGAARTPVETDTPRDGATDWRVSLPVIQATGVKLRELRLSDAPSLLTLLTTDEVSRFISPPPSSLSGFERFILWTHRERASGMYVCYGIVPEGVEQAVGIIQVRQLNSSFESAEWGFALGSDFWGSGVFVEAARSVVTFTFERIGANRLEARAAVENGRGNGVLQKLGATREGILRKSFLREGRYHDQVLWSIVASDWRERSRTAAEARH